MIGDGKGNFEFDGETWNAEKVETNRAFLIYLRDHALEKAMFEHAVPLSYSVMLLGKLAEFMKIDNVG